MPFSGIVSVDVMQLELPLAEFELIKARTAEGRERAKGRGVRMGRKHKLTPHQQEEVRKRKAEGQKRFDVKGDVETEATLKSIKVADSSFRITETPTNGTLESFMRGR
jgi:DNA invertase Pin-like site-specific DNA recombinase